MYQESLNTLSELWNSFPKDQEEFDWKKEIERNKAKIIEEAEKDSDGRIDFDFDQYEFRKD